MTIIKDDGTIDYKLLAETALFHLRCVSASRNSFTTEVRDTLWPLESNKPVIRLRTPEVEEMHHAANKFLNQYGDYAVDPTPKVVNCRDKGWGHEYIRVGSGWECKNCGELESENVTGALEETNSDKGKYAYLFDACEVCPFDKPCMYRNWGKCILPEWDKERCPVKFPREEGNKIDITEEKPVGREEFITMMDEYPVFRATMENGIMRKYQYCSRNKAYMDNVLDLVDFVGYNGEHYHWIRHLLDENKSVYDFPIFATQGGGSVKDDGDNWIFVEAPNCPGFKVGDVMPVEWGITGPINEPFASRGEG